MHLKLLWIQLPLHPLLQTQRTGKILEIMNEGRAEGEKKKVFETFLLSFVFSCLARIELVFSVPI